MTSRRTLLGAAVLAAAVPARADDALLRWDAEYDILIAGGGGAGLAAAVSAAELGAHVLLTEKLAMLGGDTLRSTGYLAAPGNPAQKAAGINDSVSFYREQTFAAGGRTADPEVVTALAENLPDTVRWLTECGVVFDGRNYEIYGALYPRCIKPLLPRGSAYIRALSEKAVRSHVWILTETALETLFTTPEGRVVGARLRRSDGSEFLVHTRKGVVLTTGGFGANTALISDLAPKFAGLATDNSPGSTGDGLTIARRLGARLTNLSSVECVAGNPPGKKRHARLFIPSDFMLVNRSGERFVEEDASRRDITEALLAEGGRCWAVFDAQGESRLDPVSKKALYQALVADEAFQADTPTALAQALNLKPAALLKTLRDYNREAWGRTAPHGKCRRIGCSPIDRAPYWAYEVGLTIHYTAGGLAVDAGARCLDNDNRPIPGLYAAGEVTGSVHGLNRLGGNGLADALTFGRMAGIACASL